MGCVNQRTGEVEVRKLPILSSWHRGLSIEAVLKDLRREMAAPQTGCSLNQARVPCLIMSGIDDVP